MQDTITIVGTLGNTPRHIVSATGLPVTSFRLASSNRRFDQAQSRWVDGETNWYSVSAFRQLALNSAASLQKGDRVVVIGRLKIRNWDNGARSGLSVDLEADAIGPDLNWGTARYTRTVGSRAAAADDAGGNAAGDDESADPDSAFAGVAEPAPELQLLPDGVGTPF